MITEGFINSCFSVILNKNKKIQKDKALYRDINEIITFYLKKEKGNIPNNIKNKIDCLFKVCQMKLEDKTDSNIIDSFSLSEKYNNLTDFLETKINIEISDIEILDNIKQIRLRKKLNTLFSNYDKLDNFLSTIKDGTFESLDDIVLDYEDIVKELYSNMMEHNRGISIAASTSLDLVKDDFTSVIELLKKKYDRKNTTSTGYDIFDDQILNGGFERSRLYVFGGGSGSGKSTILTNFIVKSAIKKSENDNLDKLPLVNNVNRVYIYITLENTIEESLLRIYQTLFKKTAAQVLQDIAPFGENFIEAAKFIKTNITTELLKTNSTIIMKYFPATTISSLDLMNVIDDIISEYGDKDYIKGLYIDYLDLLRTDVKYDLFRLELGHITLSLKILAVDYNMPVITGTQLSRSVYKVQNSRELSLDQMSESIKKVEHSDFVALLSKDPVDDGLVHMFIGKNRSGKSNIPIDFKVDFSIFSFLNGNNATSATHSNISSDQMIDGFKGKGNNF